MYMYFQLFNCILQLTCLLFCDRKLPHSLNVQEQSEPYQTVNNMYNDVMFVSMTNENQNDVATPNADRNDDIYVENEVGEYDHLHSSRPNQCVPEREDERYETSTQLEGATYSTVRKIRNSVPDRDNEYDSIEASQDNTCRSVANPDYEFCYQSSQKIDI